MADLDKTGISTGEDVEATDITKLYDALTGDDTFDNVYSNKGKIYRALLSQSGTNAPTATILENTLGGTPTYSYSSTGVYQIVLAGLFEVAKTLLFVGGIAGSIACEVDDGIVLATRNAAGTLANSLLSSTSISVIAYP